jgi:hypothetical protein
MDLERVSQLGQGAGAMVSSLCERPRGLSASCSALLGSPPMA